MCVCEMVGGEHLNRISRASSRGRRRRYYHELGHYLTLADGLRSPSYTSGTLTQVHRTIYIYMYNICSGRAARYIQVICGCAHINMVNKYNSSGHMGCAHDR